MRRPFRRRPRQLTLPGISAPKAGRPARPAPDGRGGPIARARHVLVTPRLTRRRFLSRALTWVTVAIAGALGAPAVAAVVSPAFRRQRESWNPIGRLREPESGEPDLSIEGVPHFTHFSALVEDAYLAAAPRNVPVIVVNHGEGQFTVFDVRCTHLGCPVSWQEKDAEYHCPCHNGLFDTDGRVLGGPPPRPLDRYEYKIEDGVLFAGRLYQVNDQLERITT